MSNQCQWCGRIYDPWKIENKHNELLMFCSERCRYEARSSGWKSNNEQTNERFYKALTELPPQSQKEREAEVFREKIRVIVFPIAAILTIILTRFVLFNLIFSDPVRFNAESYGATRNLFPVTGKDWEITLITCIVIPPVWFAFALFSALITYSIELVARLFRS